MKRILAALLFAIMIPMMGRADDKIHEIQKELNAHFAKRADFDATEKTLTAKASDITFAYDAWVKQSAVQQQEVGTLSGKVKELGRQNDLLKPALDNFDQRVNAHNAHKCTEKCSNGHCDGSCAWYTAEKAQLDADMAQLQAAYAPLDRQTAELQNEQTQLNKNGDLLDQIRKNVHTDAANWNEAEAQLKASRDANEAEITRLQVKLAKLRGENSDCFSKIPSACQMNPLLDDQCEEMHAACGKSFDGNR